MKQHPTQSGQSMTEVVVALAVITMGFLAVGAMIVPAARTTQGGLARLQATFIAEEGIEAVRSIRNAGFADVSPGVHGLQVADGRFEFVVGSDSEDQFTRSVEVVDLDVSTKQVTSIVVWDTYGLHEEVRLVTELTDR